MANIWAYRLNREIDYDDMAFSLRHFNHLDNIWGRHNIDRFATMENARLQRYNSRWRDSCNEATDSMRLSDYAYGVVSTIEMASEAVVFPPSPDRFAPGRLGVRTGVGPPKGPVVAFQLPLRAWSPAPDF
eukprot:jgi/Tetstr1/432880/TSEL_022229.t1